MKYLQNNKIIRLYSRCSDAHQVLLGSTFFSLALVVFRIFYTGHLLFAFLVWNLFLAWVPYLVSGTIERSDINNRWRLLAGFLLWLLFIPNAFYILTDLFHLDMNDGVPLWFDLALLFSFAWNGLLFGILSVRQMERIFEKKFNRKPDLLFILPVMSLNALGIFVGRYLRFNSWDVITNPLLLIRDITYLFVHPLRSRFDWSMIVCYTILLVLIYQAIKKLGRAL